MSTTIASILFVCCIVTESSEREALLFAKSLRTFGGAYVNAPIWFMVSTDSTLDRLQQSDRLDSLAVTVHPFVIDSEQIQFPFAAKTIASGYTEAEACRVCETLVWVDCDAIILSELDELRLPVGKVVGCRSVDLVNISALSSEPLLEYWSYLYRMCGCGDISPVDTVVSTIDRQSIYPHWNAGCLAVKPEHKLGAKISRKVIEVTCYGHTIAGIAAT